MTIADRPSRKSVPMSRAGRRTRWEAVLLGVLVAAGLLAWFQPWVPRVIPEEIIGVWSTQDPAYKGRALEIQARAVIFRGGESGEQAVRRVRRDPMGALIRYSIEYDAEGGPATLSLTYSPASGVIRLNSRPNMLWHRFGR